MRNKYLYFLLLICAGIALFGFTGAKKLFKSPSPPIVHELTIMKINNQWKVVHTADKTKTRVKAKRGEKIVWKAQGSDVYFQFMDYKLFDDYTRVLKDGKKISLVIGKKAKADTNRYAVFVAKDMVFATGDSPPEIVIE